MRAHSHPSRARSSAPAIFLAPGKCSEIDDKRRVDALESIGRGPWRVRFRNGRLEITRGQGVPWHKFPTLREAIDNALAVMETGDE